MEGEQRVAAHENVGEACCRDACHKDGQQRCHAQVYHEHLKGEHKSGYRSLEDACNGGGGATAHKQHKGLVVHLEQLPEA